MIGVRVTVLLAVATLVLPVVVPIVAPVARADGDGDRSLEREVPAPPTSTAGIALVTVETTPPADLLHPGDDATSVARLLLAAAECTDPGGQPASAWLGEWSHHAIRLQRWLRGQGDTVGPVRIDATLRDFPPLRNLRHYAVGSAARMPDRVLAVRGGTEVECALAVATLAQLLGMKATLTRHLPEGVTGEPDDGSLVVAHWTVNVPAFRDGRFALHAAKTKAIKSSVSDAIREMLDAHTMRLMTVPLPADAHADARRRALEERARLLEMVLGMYEAAPDAAKAWPATIVARTSRLIEVYDNLKELLPPGANDERQRLDERVGELLAKVAEHDRITPALLMTLGRRAIKAELWDEARQRLERLLDEFSDSEEAFEATILLARVYDKLERVADALRVYAQAFELGAGTVDDCARAADLAWNPDDTSAAMPFYDHAEQRSYAGTEMYMRRGIHWRDEAGRAGTEADSFRHRVQSRAAYRTATIVEPTHRPAWLELVRIELELAAASADRAESDRWVQSALDSAAGGRQLASDGAIFHKIEAMIRDRWLGDLDGWRRAMRAYLSTPEGESDRAARAEFDRRK